MVVDYIGEFEPPFQPSQAIEETVRVCEDYEISHVQSDKFDRSKWRAPDAIDHPKGKQFDDDRVNAMAGAVYLAFEWYERPEIIVLG